MESEGGLPFESYELYRGMKKRSVMGMNIEGSHKVVGVLKAMIRIIFNKDDPPMIDLKTFLTPKV